MTKNEFLEGLRKALGNDLDRETVQENVAYYDGYISSSEYWKNRRRGDRGAWRSVGNRADNY